MARSEWRVARIEARPKAKDRIACQSNGMD
jgi:hypothetical protein